MKTVTVKNDFFTEQCRGSKRDQHTAKQQRNLIDGRQYRILVMRAFNSIRVLGSVPISQELSSSSHEEFLSRQLLRPALISLRALAQKSMDASLVRYRTEEHNAQTLMMSEIWHAQMALETASIQVSSASKALGY